MGSSAFRGQYSVVLPYKSNRCSNMSCEECNVKFSLLKRKRTCNDCGSTYCTTCLKRSKGSPRCHRCCIFAVVPLDRNAVTSLKVRDLRWFLETNKIPSQGCKEKVDLVDLVMHHASLRNASLAYPQNYERHTVRPENVQPESAESSPVFQPTHHSPRGITSANVHIDENLQVEEIEEDGFTLISLEAGIERLPGENDTLPSGESSNTEVPVETSPEASDVLPDVNESTPELDKSESSSYATLSINDITDIDQISSLSVMQLKLILTRNFVGFKGCCEKQELQDKVRNLWTKKQETKDIENIPDENLCKICMESAIDSVLLDCGHLVSCTECGKRLNECPVCRQYVVRVVHIFKA